MVHNIKGNLLDTNCQYICHQVNCAGKMNSGVAKAIRERWPVVYVQYLDWHMSYDAWAHATITQEPEQLAATAMLGNIQIIPVNIDQSVINMAAQATYGYDGRRYTSYDAFWMCLGEIKNKVPEGSSVAFPCYIGCCRGGANWAVIKTMIETVLGEDYEVYIYEL